MELRKTKLSRSKCTKCGEIYLTHHLRTKFCQKCFDEDVKVERFIKGTMRTIDFVYGIRDSDDYTLPEICSKLR